MYLLAKSGDIGSCKNEDINSYNNSFMDTFEKAEVTASIRHAVTFLKLGIPIYNSEIPDTAGRRARRTTQTTAKRYAFHENAKKNTNRKIYFLIRFSSW